MVEYLFNFELQWEVKLILSSHSIVPFSLSIKARYFSLVAMMDVITSSSYLIKQKIYALQIFGDCKIIFPDFF
jgi:hypothetical protein